MNKYAEFGRAIARAQMYERTDNDLWTAIVLAHIRLGVAVSDEIVKTVKVLVDSAMPDEIQRAMKKFAAR